MSRSKNLLVVLCLVWTSILAACSGEAPQEAAGDQLKVYASVYPLADFAEKIGGKHADVTLLVPPGVEPHDFEPTPKDLTRLSRADVFLYNGIGFEAWIGQAKEILDSERTVIADASASLEPLYSGSNGSKEADPHVWLDPVRAKKMAESIRDALIKADPDHAADYRTNFGKLSRRFNELDRTFREISNKAEKREFVVSHAAFSYLADRYGLHQIAISGLSPSDEPGPKELKAVIEAAKRHRVKVIFFDSLVPGKVAKTVKEEVGAEALVLNPLEGLKPREAETGEDYFSIMEKNAENLGKALGSAD
jgi:zinc transport system substrate-binding protein